MESEQSSESQGIKAGEQDWQEGYETAEEALRTYLKTESANSMFYTLSRDRYNGIKLKCCAAGCNVRTPPPVIHAKFGVFPPSLSASQKKKMIS